MKKNDMFIFAIYKLEQHFYILSFTIKFKLLLLHMNHVFILLGLIKNNLKSHRFLLKYSSQISR